MRLTGATLPVVFFDLSRLDLASAVAFLGDLAGRDAWQTEGRASTASWVLGPTKNVEVLQAAGPGPDFLRTRLASGDQLVCANPTGFDWNSLFPAEAALDEQYARNLVGYPVELLLTSTPTSPDWLAGRPGRVLRIATEGLWVEAGTQRGWVPWASKESRGGVWWLVPGQALFSLPPFPWGPFPYEHLSSDRNPETEVPALAPREKEELYAVGVARRNHTTSRLRQAILLAPKGFPGLGARDVVDFEESLGGVRKRALIANMQGQTDLKEAGLHVRFSGGKLVSVVDEKTGAEWCTGAESSITWGGKRRPFVVNSAFSFEGDYSWGLRQSLILNHEDLEEPGRAIVDFFFVQESPELFVSVTVRWPRWKTPTAIQRWGILETSLFELPGSQPLTTRAYSPDGSAADRIWRKPKTGRLIGTDFALASGSGGLVMGFPQNQTMRPHALPWEVARVGGKARLVVNPEGGLSPKPSSQFDGVEEHFSVYLTRSEGAKLPFEVTRKQAIELITPHLDIPTEP